MKPSGKEIHNVKRSGACLPVGGSKIDKRDDIRLQVFLSHSGVCSRRDAMTLIQNGKVWVNGEQQKEPSTRVVPGKDKVVVNGVEIKEKGYEYILFNKPNGFVTTKAEYSGQRTIFDILPPEFKHLSPVGRLDKDTQGLLLLTNDGDLAFQLTHPKFNVNKVYQVRIDGKLLPPEKNKLENGVIIEGKHMTAPAKIQDVQALGNQTSFLMTIHEGRKRQIRMMMLAVGHNVVFLKRLSQGPLQLGDLELGRWRLLNALELTSLRKG